MARLLVFIYIHASEQEGHVKSNIGITMLQQSFIIFPSYVTSQ